MTNVLAYRASLEYFLADDSKVVALASYSVVHTSYHKLSKIIEVVSVILLSLVN